MPFLLSPNLFRDVSLSYFTGKFLNGKIEAIRKIRTVPTSVVKVARLWLWRGKFNGFIKSVKESDIKFFFGDFSFSPSFP